MKIDTIRLTGPEGRFRSIFFVIFISISFILIPAAGSCQFFPQPQLIDSKKSAGMEELLKNSPAGKEKLKALLALSNIYCFKPLKSVSGIAKSIAYGRQAKSLAMAIRDEKGLNDACIILANGFLQVDSLEKAEDLLKYTTGQSRRNLLLTLGFSYMITKKGSNSINMPKARSFIDGAFKLAGQADDQNTRITALSMSGALHTARGAFDLAEKDLNASLVMAGANHYPNLQYIYMNFTQLYLSNGNYDKALSFALKSIDRSRKMADTAAIGDANFLLGFVFRNTGQIKKSADHFQQAMDTYLLRQGTLETITDVIESLGQVMIGERKYLQALRYFQQNYKKYPAINFEGRQVEIGAIGDCYLKLKKYDIAQRYFLSEFRRAKEAHSLNETAFHRISYFYIEAGMYAKAIPSLKRALSYVSTASIQTRGHLYYMLYMAESGLGNYPSAVKYLLKNRECDEIIYQDSRVRELQDLTVRYESEKKNQQIAFLKKSEQMQRTNLKNAELIGNLSMSAIVLLLLTGIVFFVQYRKRLQLSATIDHKNKELGNLLDEKEWLLKEVHHRVKNNLHTIISLLHIQSEFLEGDALQAIENSQNRIYAISLIHKKLYLADDSKFINLKVYLTELIDYLKESFGPDPEVRYELDIDPLNVDIAYAIPLGIILNEAVSNSIKHAFSGRTGNNVSLKLTERDGRVEMEIADNGRGMPEPGQPGRSDSLGIKLIHGLSREIDAKVEFTGSMGGTGTRIKITFHIVENNNLIF